LHRKVRGIVRKGFGDALTGGGGRRVEMSGEYGKRDGKETERPESFILQKRQTFYSSPKPRWRNIEEGGIFQKRKNSQEVKKGPMVRVR